MLLRTLSVAAAATTLMLAAPAANAASVVVPEQTYALTYEASPGETNNITISSRYIADKRTVEVTIRDTGVAQIGVTNQRGGASPCRTGDAANVMTCSVDLGAGLAPNEGESAFFLLLYAKDGNDRITFDASTESLAARPVRTGDQTFVGWISAGDGSDTLTDLGDGEFRPELWGENGNDTLRGGIGDNYLSGGPGSDVFFGYEGADVMLGGAGTDSLTYRDGREPGGVIVNDLEESAALWPAPKLSGNSWDISAVENGPQGDIVTGMENILGTAYNDVLIGNSAANVLTGSGGKDTLYGMGGNDTLVVTGAPGRLYGGAGNDTLNARNGAADTRLDCGPDTDVANLDLIDTGWIACESTIRQ